MIKLKQLLSENIGDLPICFDTEHGELDREESHGRDIETMGGLSVEYYICPICNARYEYVYDSLNGNSLCLYGAS